MEENKEDLTNLPGQTTNIPPQTDWEKKLEEKERTIPVAGPETEVASTVEEEAVSSSEIFATKTVQEPVSETTLSSDIEIVPEDKNTPRGGKGGFWFFVLLLAFIISAFCGVYLTTKPGVHCPRSAGSDKVSFGLSSKSSPGEGLAWIKVRGVISEEDNQSPFSRPSGASYIAKRVREAAKNDRVKAIVLDINSPGGTVASVQEIYGELLKAKEQGKKIVALFRDVAASGGFYIAMAADKIVAEPGTITGSVGVIMQAGNVVGLFDKLGIQVTPITSGKYKDIGSAYRPMTDGEKAILQDMVDDTYSQFFEAVKAGRPNVKPEDLKEYTDGRVFTGQRAYNLGFIDQLGGEETARQLAGELAGLKDPKIIGQKNEGLRDILFSFGSSVEGKSVSKQLQSLSTPRVSYLWVF